MVKDVDMVRDIISSIPQEIKPMGIANSYDHVAMYLNARGIPSEEIPSLVEKALKDLSLWHREEEAYGRSVRRHEEEGLRRNGARIKGGGHLP